MIPFIHLILFRALSGLQNGLGYGQRRTWRTLTSIIMLLIVVTLAIYLHFLQLPPWQHWLALLCLLISAVGTFGVEDNFSARLNLFKRDIHFWELWATAGVTFACILMGLDLIGIACSVYPGLILHKGFVNVFGGLNWWYHGTDHASGKTFGIPSLGISIRRLPLKVRLILAFNSLLIIIITSILHFRISLYDLM